MGKRTIVGVILALLFVAMLYFGAVAQLVVFSVGAAIAVWEMGNAFKQKEIHVFLAPAYLFAASFGLWLYFLPQLPWSILLVACVLAVMIESLFHKTRSVAECLFGICILIYPLSFLALLLELGVSFENGLGQTALLLAFACPLVGDVLAYFIGSWIGKRPLCPRISPKKTVEGSIASLFGSMLGGMIAYFLQPVFGAAQLPFGLFLLVGGLCGILGQMGDLFASSIKRWAQIKDFGKLLPGHGGVLDRVDSVLFCAPVVYAAITVFLSSAG